MAEQAMSHVDKAWTNPDSPLKKSLDFSPFLAAMEGMDGARVAEIDLLLEDTTVLDIQRLFADGLLTSAELTTYYLKRIKKYDPNRHNSVLELNPDALTIASACDSAHSESSGPMHGIPILLKDNISTGDKMHTTAGAAALADHHADRDAFIVTKLRDAGAVILGKANLSEWAYFMNYNAPSGYSALGGHTRNAYGRFDCGGSSSGSGVAVSANFATMAIGSETFGSLISPSTQNSLCTIKASLALISRDRIVPITAAQDTAGPMTRNMTDLAVLLTAIAGVDSNDPTSNDAADLANVDFTDFLDANALQGKRIGLVSPTKGAMAEEFAKRLKETQPLLDAAVTALEDAGATVSVIDYAHSELEAQPILFMGMKHDLRDYLEATDAPVKSVEEVVAFNQESMEDRAYYKQELLELSAEDQSSRAEYDITLKYNRHSSRRELRLKLAQHKVDMFVSIANWSTCEYCPQGSPAVCVPMGYKASGEPQSITFFGDFLDDGKLIAAGYAFEQATKLRVPPDLDAWVGPQNSE